MKQLTFSWTVTVHAPVEQIFSFMQDRDNAFRALGCGDPQVQVCDVVVKPGGLGTTGRNVFPVPGLKRLGTHGSVTNEIIEVDPNRRIVVRTTSSMGRLFKFEGTWAWTFEPENGETKLIVNYSESASWPVYVLDRVTAKRQTREFGEAIAGWLESEVQAREARNR
jgi:uncharacterized protein YndB with AHSA1/START domain